MKLRTLILLVATALALGGMVATSPPASAATNQFRGMNWAVLGDNFSRGPLVISGLSQTDSNATVRAKANALYDDMAAIGVNTVRLPINTHTVGTTWWNNYRGAIDAATARGFKVILAYWEDGAASSGRVTNYAAWNTMWSRVTSLYGSNTNVYFEPMNEPHGYSSTEWRNVAAEWLRYHYSAVPSRVLIGGTGFSQDLRDICNDSRFNGTLMSFHYYAFFTGPMTYDGLAQPHPDPAGQLRLARGDDRVRVADVQRPQLRQFVQHRQLRALPARRHRRSCGTIRWVVPTGPRSAASAPMAAAFDWYSMFALSGSGTDLNLTVRNSSGRDRIRYGWGL